MNRNLMQLVVLDYLELPDTDWQRLHELVDIVSYGRTPQSEAEILTRLEGFEGVLITTATALSTEVISQLPQLRCILVPGVGTDHIAVKAAQAQGIEVLNCPTYSANAVAEFTLGLMFAIARRLVFAHHTVQTGQWDPQNLPGTELSGQHLVVIGAGTIGQTVAQKAVALGMRVSTATSHTAPGELDGLIAAADFLSLHVPLTSATYHLIDARRLALMKPTAYLINTARGGVVDNTALLAALQGKHIAGAALDVLENEPTTGQPNDTILALTQQKNAIVTPHMAYNTDTAIRRLGQELIENLEKWLRQCSK